MTIKRFKSASAFTLIEVMVAMVVLTIAALGALGYQYHAGKHTRIAEAQTTATRTARLLLEDWKSTGGSAGYDPSTLGLGFSSTLVIPDEFGHGYKVGVPLDDRRYAVKVNDMPMLVLLASRDVAYDSAAEVTLRELSVMAANLRMQSLLDKYEQTSLETTTSDGFMDEFTAIEPITLTTYVRLDAAGG